MFQGLNQVLEIGAGDGFKSKIVAQNVKNLTLCDSEEINLKMYNSKDNNYSKLKYIKHDFIKKALKSKYDGIYLLDVLEHISKKSEVKFIKNISKSLKRNSVFIIGIPSTTFWKSSLGSNSFLKLLRTSDIRSIPIKSYNANTPVFGIPIGLPNTASASSIERFIEIASVIAICIE